MACLPIVLCFECWSTYVLHTSTCMADVAFPPGGGYPWDPPSSLQSPLLLANTKKGWLCIVGRIAMASTYCSRCLSLLSSLSSLPSPCLVSPSDGAAQGTGHAERPHHGWQEPPQPLPGRPGSLHSPLLASLHSRGDRQKECVTGLD